MILAALAVAALLQGVLSLSERRGAFVSAVTHELRTPLTTFRMYAEMLADNMVPDETSRRHYLETLRVEADRLTHLVENVLLYARLERGRPGGRIAPVAVSQIFEQAIGRLADRARQANLEIATEASDQVRESRVLADPAAVEQILFNLVDNACKYAASATNRTLHLEARRNGNYVELLLRDHGPGIAAEQAAEYYSSRFANRPTMPPDRLLASDCTRISRLPTVLPTWGASFPMPPIRMAEHVSRSGCRLPVPLSPCGRGVRGCFVMATLNELARRELQHTTHPRPLSHKGRGEGLRANFTLTSRAVSLARASALEPVWAEISCWSVPEGLSPR